MASRKVHRAGQKSGTGIIREKVPASALPGRAYPVRELAEYLGVRMSWVKAASHSLQIMRVGVVDRNPIYFVLEPDLEVLLEFFRAQQGKKALAPTVKRKPIEPGKDNLTRYWRRKKGLE